MESSFPSGAPPVSRQSFQGLVLQAGGARVHGSEEWESELETARGGGYHLYCEASPFAVGDGRHSDEARLRALNAENPSVTNESVVGSHTRRETDLQAEDEIKAEDPTRSGSAKGKKKKKERKRANYLSHEDRCQIIERVAGGEQQAALAREFGVTRAAVCHIQKHRLEILARPVIPLPIREGVSTAEPSRIQQLVHEVRTPSALALLTTLRDHRSDSSSFRRAAGRVIMILIEEALGQLDARAVEITTSSGHVTTGIEQIHQLCGVKLGDEGYPFSVLFHQVEVDAAEGFIHVGSVVDQHGLRQWCLDRMDLPATIASCKVFLFTATCSTGGRECKAIEALCSVGTLENDITLVAIVCASDGVVAVCSRFPQVRIVTVAIDGAVDPSTGGIVPGFGDFIARYNDEHTR